MKGRDSVTGYTGCLIGDPRYGTDRRTERRRQGTRGTWEHHGDAWMSKASPNSDGVTIHSKTSPGQLPSSQEELVKKCREGYIAQDIDMPSFLLMHQPTIPHQHPICICLVQIREGVPLRGELPDGHRQRELQGVEGGFKGEICTFSSFRAVSFLTIVFSSFFTSFSAALISDLSSITSDQAQG